MISKKKNIVLLVGPLVPPYNGQAIAFSLVVENFPPKKRIVVDTAKYDYKFLNTLNTALKTIFIFCFYRFSTIYFTSSRSPMGFWKDFVLLVLARWSNKKVINHLHGADFKGFYDDNPIIRPFISYGYKAVDTSIVLSDEMKQEFVSFPEMKVETVYNCYSDNLNLGKSFYIKKKQLLYLSNLIKSKGILEFLQACDILLDKFPVLSVKIAGSPLADNSMSKEAIQKKFEEQYSMLQNRYGDRIFYIGNVEGENKKKLLYESSIFILPSYYRTEAYPLSIIEAMRTGNAIVTTFHNYLPSIVKPANGILVEPRSSQAIVNGVVALLQDEIKLKEIQENNVTEAKGRYTQQRYIREVKSIID